MNRPMKATNMPTRVVTAEILDDLVENDPRAQRSRRDLQRLNRVMASRRLFVRALAGMTLDDGPREILELGAGDGTFMLRLARALRARWPATHVTLLDRLDLVDGATSDALRELGWHVDILQADVMDWAAQAAPRSWHLILANLFLHHFSDDPLRGLLHAIARRTDRFVALEPRRGDWPLLASRLVGAIGCNDVTRADAVASVRAGFRGAELSMLWPADRERWHLSEHAAGAFSHCFVAQRIR